MEAARLRPETGQIRDQLSRILASAGFINSARMREFLTCIVENALSGDAPVKEALIGVQVFGRAPGYDSNLEPIVRVEARRLRAKLQGYYDGEGIHDPVLIDLPKGGYTPEFELRVAQEPIVLADTTPVATVRPHRSSGWAWVAAALCVVLAFGALIGHSALSGPSHPARLVPAAAANSISSIAVLPLANLSGNPTDDYLAEGMTDELIGSLANISGLRVISMTSSMVYQKARKPLPQIAKELNVDAVVQGSVARSKRQLRITAQLIQARQDRVLWSEDYTRSLHDLLAVEGEVAQAIANQVQLTIAGSRELTPKMQAQADVPPVAGVAYLKGRYFWNKRTEESLRTSIAYFQDAVRQAPDFARGWAGLADSWLLLGELWQRPNAFAQARIAVEKALSLDDRLGQAHACKAALEADRGRWDLARPEFRRALELSPNYATSHQWYAEDLAKHGRTNEAIHEIERAREIDPLSLTINVQVGYIFYVARQYDKAIAQLRATIDMDPFFWLAHANLASAYEQKGMYAEAVEEFQKAVDLTHQSPRQQVELARAWALAGKQAQAREMRAELDKTFRGDRAETPSLALLDVALGDPDRALARIQAACSKNGPPLFSRSPFFDPLRANKKIDAVMNTCTDSPNSTI